MTVDYSGNLLAKVVDDDPVDNSANDMFNRTAGRIISVTPTINLSAGANVSNVFQITGSVRILDQWAEILAISGGAITAVYATLYDGTNTVNLTANGMDLTGASVGSFFTKDKVAANTYSLNNASQCRMLETLDDRKAGRPFTVTQKYGANTYIRLHATAASQASLSLRIHFEYLTLNGGTLTALI